MRGGRRCAGIADRCVMGAMGPGASRRAAALACVPGRARQIAARLVEALASNRDRRAELARLAHWRAGLVWESLERPRIRDRPFEARSGGGAVAELPGALQVHFRPRRALLPAAVTGLRARRQRDR